MPLVKTHPIASLRRPVRSGAASAALLTLLFAGTACGPDNEVPGSSGGKGGGSGAGGSGGAPSSSGGKGGSASGGSGSGGAQAGSGGAPSGSGGSGGAQAGSGGTPSSSGGAGGSSAGGSGGGSTPPDAAAEGGSPEPVASGACTTMPAMTPPGLKKTPVARLPGGNAGQIAGPPGEKGIIYAIAHGSGNVYAIQNGTVAPMTFAKVTVNNGDRELGLLSIAFHPDFASNQLFYLSYTAADKAMTTDEFKRTSPTSAEFVRNVYMKPREGGGNYHNGGTIYFNPKDGKAKPWLYHSVGNESTGGAGDPMGKVGRILRYDVTTKMGVPGTAGGVGGFTFAYGLRNPYRMSIDRLTGDMYVADVAGGKGGAVFFNAYGTEGTNFGFTSNSGELQGPRSITGIDRASDGIIGGVVYRGSKIPGLCGRYFYGFYPSGVIKSLVVQDGKAAGQTTHDGALSVSGLSSFGEDGEGEIYMSSHDSNQIWKLEAQ